MKKIAVNFVFNEPYRNISIQMEQKSDIKNALTSYFIKVTITDSETTRMIQKNVESCPVLKNPLEVIGFVFATWPELNESFERPPEPHPDPIQELRRQIDAI